MILNLLEYQKALESIKRENNSFSRIAGLLLWKIKSFDKLTTATALAEESYVSNATITKFIKHLGCGNFNEMAFIHNQNKEVVETKVEVIDANFKSAADALNKAKKIFFIGVSNSHYINSDFANKLTRIDKWVINTPSKYEQVGLSKILTDKDIIIVNSVSLQHTWMIEIMKKTAAKIILVSSVDPATIKVKPTFYFRLTAKERSDHFRVTTEENRLQALKIFDSLFHALIQNKTNYDLLHKTSYK